MINEQDIIKDIQNTQNILEKVPTRNQYLVGLCPNNHWEFDNGYLEL